jgi:hypothetical protein
MNTTAKIILIAFGSMIVLLVALVALLAFVIMPRFVSSSMTASRDPAAGQRLVHDIGFSKIPPGYRTGFVTDLGLTKLAVLRSVDRTRGRFSISITKTTIPMFGILPRSQADEESSKQGAAMALHLACKAVVALPSETIRAGTRTIAVDRFACDDSFGRRETAITTITVPNGMVQLNASGPAQSFDMAAVRALLASFR